MKTPAPHQRQAIRRVLKSLRRRGRDVRCQYVMACGTGKTFVGLRVHENLKSKLTVVFVPTLHLLAQFKREWGMDRRSKYSSLAVCSDRTVTEGVPVKARDLGLVPTTDPHEIAAFMRRKGPKVLFSTYLSSSRIVEAQAIANVEIDLILCDEAHRTTGAERKPFFQTPLDNQRLRARRRLFQTATPKIYTGGQDPASMDDEALYGPRVFEYSLRQAIQDKRLCDYRVVLVTVSDEEVAAAISDHSFLSHKHRDMLVEDVARHVGVAKAIKQFGLKRVVAFVNRVATAAAYGSDENLRGFMPTMQNTRILSSKHLWTDHLEAKMSVGQRQLRMDVLANPREDITRVLYNAKCLTEGIDSPAMDAVAFLERRTSVVDVTQIVGRPLRLPPGWIPSDENPCPPLAYIIVPIFLPQGQSLKTIRQTEAFRRLLQILRALRTHDDRLVALGSEKIRGNRTPPGSPLQLLFGPKVSLKFRQVASAIVAEATNEFFEKPFLNEKDIRTWANVWKQETGKRPHARSGDLSHICGYPQTWKAIDSALKCGRRGILRKGSSLYKLLGSPDFSPPPLDETEIQSWGRKFRKRHGHWPRDKDGDLSEFCGYPQTWKTVCAALRLGKRGLPGNSSLAVLFGKKSSLRKPKLSRSLILKWAKVWHAETGSWPAGRSGDLSHICGYSETWMAINSALVHGTRGLKGGSSLFHLLQPTTGKIKKPSLAVDKIMTWAQQWEKETGKWPDRLSGNLSHICGYPETWTAVDRALVDGLRGLVGGTTLYRLIRNPAKKDAVNS